MWNRIRNAECLQCSGKLSWGWVVCLSFLILFTISAGVAFSYAEIMVYLNKEVHASLTLLSWMGTMPVSLPMLAAPVATWLNFKLGTQKTVFIGVFLTSFALSLTALVNNIGLMFLVYGVLGGSGILLIVNPPFFLLDEYFPYHHPRHVLATSLIACGFPLATLIFNPVTYSLLVWVGWRITYSIFAIVMFVIGCAAAATFRPKYAGMSLSGQPAPTKEEYENIIDDDDEDGEIVAIAKRTRWILGGLWLAASTLKSMGYYTPFVTLVKQMEVMGIPQAQSAKAMSVVGGCEVASRVITSWLGDYVKGKILYVYIICTFVLCVQNALGSLAHTFDHLLIYAAILGVFGGPVIAAMYSSCSEVLDNQEVPMLFSVFRVGLGLGGLLGPTVAGAIFDTTNSFHLVFYVNAFTYALTSVLYVIILVLTKTRPKWCYPDVTEETALIRRNGEMSSIPNGSLGETSKGLELASFDGDMTSLRGERVKKSQENSNYGSYKKGWEVDCVSNEEDEDVAENIVYNYDSK